MHTKIQRIKGLEKSQGEDLGTEQHSFYVCVHVPSVSQEKRQRKKVTNQAGGR